MATFNLFTDGSAIIDEKFYEASSAFVITNEVGRKILGGGSYLIRGTISRGEAFAVLLGLRGIENIQKHLKTKVTVNIYLDSAFVKDSLTKWIHMWRKQGDYNIWINSQGNPVAHQDVFKTILHHYMSDKKFEINFFKVNGHVGQKIKFADAHKKFNIKHNTNISKEEFTSLVAGNEAVDELADKVRIERLRECVVTYPVDCPEGKMKARSILDRTIIHKRDIIG